MKPVKTISPAFIIAFVLFTSPLWAKGPKKGMPDQRTAQSFPSVMAHSETPNIADFKEQLNNYYYSGRYEQEISQVVNQAAAFLQENAGKYEKPAIVFDIDETTLSNWISLAESQFNFVLADWNSWVQEGRAWAIGPSQNLYNMAREMGVAIFFITGRKENQREATEKNLEAAGYKGWEAIHFKKQHYDYTAEYKAGKRKAIEEMGYTILFTMGDQQSDLSGGFALATFKVPNPFYLIK